MREKEKPVHPIKKREDVHRVAEYLRERYEYGEMLRIMFLIGCNTGLRAGDIRGLKIESLLNKDSFTVQESKTKKTRHIHINAALKNAIIKYIKEPRLKNKIKGNKLLEITEFNIQDESAYVLVGGQGMVIGVKYMHYVISDACRNLNIKGNFGSHSMRKTFAFHVYQRTGDLNAVKEILQHSDIKLTQLYIHDKRSLKRVNPGVKKPGPANGAEEGSVKDSYEINLI